MHAPATGVAAEVEKENTHSNQAGQSNTAPGIKTRPAAQRRANLLAGHLILRIIFLLGLVLIVHALAYIADTVAPDSSTRFLQLDRQHLANILADSETIDALAIGNSHTGSIQMPALGYDHGYRFARADGDLFESLYLIKYLQPRLPKLNTVFIPISYFSFLEQNTASSEVNIRRVHMYGSLPAWHFIPGDLEPFLVGKSHTYFPVARLIREDNWEGVLRAWMGRPTEPKGFIEVAAGDCSYLNAAQLAVSAENRVAKYMRLTSEMHAHNPNLAQDSFAALVKTSQYLESQDVKLIFYTPPYWQGYIDQYMSQDAETIRQMQSFMQRLQQEQGVPYFDFSQDPEFAANPALFKDSDHLNSCGAEQFSKKLNQKIHMDQARQP